MSATEASRSFAALLDDAQNGNAAVPDQDFADDVRAARDAVPFDGPQWPAD